MAERYRPSIRDVVRNWRSSTLPLARKLRLTASNEARKIVTLKTCCGHTGEPGCCMCSAPASDPDAKE